MRSAEDCRPRRSKPADFFGNDDVLYLMEDMATGEIRLSILWEWLHKGATLTDADPTGVKAGDTFTARALRADCCVEEYEKLQPRDATATCTMCRRPPRCPSRARSSRPTCCRTRSCRGTSTFSTSISTTTTSAKRSVGFDLLADAFRKDGTRVTWRSLDFSDSHVDRM